MKLDGIGIFVSDMKIMVEFYKNTLDDVSYRKMMGKQPISSGGVNI